MQLKDAIESRKSVKRFSHKKPDWKKIIEAINYARFAPSAGNSFVTRFILVDDEKKIAELAASSQQEFVGTAQYIVVVVSDEYGLVRDYDERGRRYCSQQSGAAIQNFLLALTEQKLVTTWVGYFYEEQVRRTLDIPLSFNVEAMFPIGLPTKLPSKTARKMKLDDVIFFNKWNNRNMVPNIKFSQDAL